jgi:outer membrane protein assembly factor BamB
MQAAAVMHSVVRAISGTPVWLISVLRRKTVLRFTLAACLACCCLLSVCSRPACAQVAAGEDVEQRGVLRRIEEVEESLQKESWLEAVQRFDDAWRLASEGADVLLESRGAEIRQLAPGTADALAGGKARLEQVYRDAGPEFRRLYAEQFNETAAKLLRELVERGETHRLKSVASRYKWTPAASEALQLLARMHIDAGDFLEAGLLLERASRFSDPAPPVVTLKAAWCFAKAGLLAEAEELSASAKAAVSTAGMPLAPPLQKLLNELELLAQSGETDPSPTTANWLQPLGNYRRTQRQTAASIRLAGNWNTNLLQLQDVLYADRLNPLLAEIARQLEQFWRNGVERGILELPAGQPLAMGNRVFVRTPFSIQSWNSTNGELLWEVARPDRELREAVEGLSAEPGPDGQPQLADGQLVSMATALGWQLHLQQVRGITAAQMAISGSTLFVVEETAASGNEMDAIPGMIRGMPTISSNFIRAYDANTGLFLWEIGGQMQNAVPGQPGSSNLLAGYYFLGAPLVLGSRIYVLAENGEGIYIIRIGEPVAGFAGTNPQILSSQLLTTPDRKLPEHPLRRYAGLMPAYAQGLLICPTCDNRVVAVSAEDLSIRWVARYAGVLQRQEIGDSGAFVLRGAQDSQRTIAVDMENRWYDFLPRVANGKVLLTPRDADQLLCLDLQTGRQLWKAARGGYHAVAGLTDTDVILAGRRQVGALNLETGNPVWTTPLREGVVCGSGVFTGTLLQLPTSTPALVSINIADGQVLASQPWSADVQPGNLLSLPEGTLVQGITSLTWLPRVTQDLQPIERATQLLLAGDSAAGRAVLETQLQQQPGDQTVRMLLVDLLLNELRRGQENSGQLIPQIEKLLTELAREAELGPLLHALLGMTLPDAATLPGLLRTAGRQREEEFREILLQREATQSNGAPLNQLLPRLERMIRQLPEAMLAAAPANGVERSQADVLASSIRTSLAQRPETEQAQLQSQLVSAAVATATPMNPEERLNFASVLLRCGLPEAAAGTLDPPDSSLEVGMNANNVAELARMQRRLEVALEIAQLTAFQKPANNAPAQLAKLLQNLLQSDARWPAWSLVQALKISGERFPPHQQLLQSGLKLLAESDSELRPESPPPSSWPAEFQIDVSDDRSLIAESAGQGAIPWQPIPLYSSSTFYRGWNLAWINPGNRIAAYDPDGVLQWEWQPTWNVQGGSGGYQLDSWAFATGRILVLHLRGVVVALDLTHTEQRTSPQLLWKVTPERAAPRNPQADPRDFVPPEERIEQYQLLPGGHFPVGPVSEFGVPLISAGSLQMLNLFTGDRLWELDVIPPDARLLLDDDRLLILSDSARRTEVRSAVDGTLLATHHLPDWWGEAGSNQGLSAEEIDVEEGTDTLWRVLAEDHRCVLFRLTAGETRLECRDLLTDNTLWQHVLPQKTVVSNLADGAVALLSDGKQLRIVDLAAGTIRVNRELTPVSQPRKLYLRATQGVFVVLPEALSEEDPSLDFFNPLIDAVHVHGRIYGIRQNDGTVAWEHAIRHRQLRLEHSSQTRPLLPVLPLLVLLTRERDPAGTGSSVVVGTEVLDVRSGKVVYSDPNTGLTQNLLWMFPSKPGELLLSFDRRFVRFSKNRPD